jgi:hypothetical protein
VAPSRTPRLIASCAAVLALCLFVLAGSASAHITGSYFIDHFTHFRTLHVESDEAADTIVPACSGGSVSVNGQVVTIQGQTIACGGSRGPERIEVVGQGGNDKLDVTHISRGSPRSSRRAPTRLGVTRSR